MENKFEQQLSQLDIRLTERQKEQFHQYYELLVEWNKVMNLTGITEYDEVNEKHFVDSLAIVKTVDMNQVNSVIDIGTGAGFPAVWHFRRHCRCPVLRRVRYLCLLQNKITGYNTPRYTDIRYANGFRCCFLCFP